MKRPSREINIFSVSALDLFASAMGSFILIAVMLFPYYQKSAIVRDLDLVFVMDTTGSMGKEIKSMQQNLILTARVLRKASPRLRVGFVVYRDRGAKEAYLVRSLPLTAMDPPGEQRLQDFINQLDAKGGGDWPEAVEAGLERARDMAWNRKSRNLILVIGDAPAHRNAWARALALATRFAGDGHTRKVSTILIARSTKVRAAGEPFFKRLAQAGKGEYADNIGQLMYSVLLMVLESPG